MHIEIWDKKTHFRLGDGKERTMEEVAEEFPFITDPDAVIVLEYLGKNRVGAIDELYTLRNLFHIDENLTDEEALQEYIKIRTAPPPEPLPQPGSIADDFILGILEGSEQA